MDAADRPRADPRQHPLQRHRPRAARHLPLAARPAAAPPRAQGRGRAVAVADRAGQRVPPHRRPARTSKPSSRRSGDGPSSGCSTTCSPHEVDPVTLTWWMHRRIDTERLPPGRVVIEFDHTAPKRQADLDGARPWRGLGVRAAPRLRPRRRGHDDDAGAGRGVPGLRQLDRAPSPSEAIRVEGPPALVRGLSPGGSCGARSPTPPATASPRRTDWLTPRRHHRHRHRRRRRCSISAGTRPPRCRHPARARC